MAAIGEPSNTPALAAPIHRQVVSAPRPDLRFDLSHCDIIANTRSRSIQGSLEYQVFVPGPRRLLPGGKASNMSP